MRIALLTERMRAGFGADLAHHHIADHLARRGHRVTVFASVADGSYGEAAYELVRVPVPATTWFPRYEANARRALVPVLASSPDLVLVGTFPFFSLLPELAARVPCVAIDFGICSTEGFRLWTRLNFAYMRFTQHRRYFPHARRIVAISEFVRRELPASLQDRTSVIYLGVDHYPDEDAREARARELRRARGIGDDETLALYVGRLNPAGQPYKGTAELVRVYQEARKAAPGLRLMMAGVGGPEDERWLSGAGRDSVRERPRRGDAGALHRRRPLRDVLALGGLRPPARRGAVLRPARARLPHRGPRRGGPRRRDGRARRTAPRRSARVSWSWRATPPCVSAGAGRAGAGSPPPIRGRRRWSGTAPSWRRRRRTGPRRPERPRPASR